MAGSLRSFTDEELGVLKEVVRLFRNGLINRRSFDPPTPGPSAPETYIAKTPTGGIESLTGGDTPGSADCDVYQIVDGALVAVSSGDRTVYNLSSQDVDEDEWVLIQRDKYGKWILVNTVGGGATGTGSGCFRIIVDEALPGTIEADPDYILGVKDNCMVVVAIGQCTSGSGTG